MASLQAESSLEQKRFNERRAPPKSTGLRTFEPVDFDEENVSYFDSVGAAFMSSGIATGAYNVIADGGVFDHQEYDDKYDVVSHFEGNAEWLEAIRGPLEDPEHPHRAAVLGIIEESRNANHTDILMNRYLTAVARQEDAIANGLGANLIGTIGGIGLDIAAVIGITALTGGAGAPTAAGLTGGAARLAGIAKGATFGAVEGFGERQIQKLTDPLVTNEDAYLAAGLGAGIVGLIGGLAPHRLMGIRRVGDDDGLIRHTNAGDEIVDEMRGDNAGTVGARMTDEAAEAQRVVEVGKGGGSVLARYTPHAWAVNLLRNPRRVLLDFGRRGADEFAKTGKQGNRAAHDKVWSRLIHFSVANADEIGGNAARRDAAEMLRTLDNVDRAAREQSSKKIYAKMSKEIFDLGALAAAAKNSELMPRRFATSKGVTMEEFEALSDEFAVMRGNSDGGVFNPQHIWTDELMAKTTSQQRDDMLPHIIANADKDDAYFLKIGNELNRLDLVKEDQLIPGYRPQRWNAETISADPNRFDNFIIDVIRRQPEQKWLEANNFDGLADEVPVEGQVAKDRLTWDEIKKDPELREEVMDAWGRAIARASEAKKEGLVKTLNSELARVRAKSYEEIFERKQKELAGTVTRKLAMEEELAKFQRLGANDPLVASQTDVLTKKIGLAEVKLDNATAALKRVQEANNDVVKMDAMIGKYGKLPSKKALKQAKKRAGKGEQKLQDAFEAKDLNRIIDDIRTALVNGDAHGIPSGAGGDDLAGSSARFKQRSLFLAELNSSPDARHFKLTNAAETRAAYVSSVSTKMSLYKAFDVTPEFLQSQGKSGLTIEQYITRQLDEGFIADKRAFTDADDIKLIRQDHERQSEMLQKIMNEYTHRDILLAREQHAALADVTNIITGAVASMSLGKIFFSLWGDLATLLNGGAQAGTGFGYVWRGLRPGKFIDEIAEGGEDALAIQAQGLAINDGSRMRNLTGTDMTEMTRPGSLLNTISRKTRAVAHLQGWANWMHPWNRFVRGGFGLDVMRQFSRDFVNFENLSPMKKTFYARIGISKSDAHAMATMLDKHHKLFVNGKLRVPDSALWMRTERGRVLMKKYQIALQKAGDEALVDPGLADRPFLRATPQGQLMMQFQTFMQTMGERVIAPMVQEAQIHPTSLRPYAAAALGLALGTASDGVRMHIRGKGDEWNARWESPEGMRDLLYAGLLRSPFMPGSSALISETAMTAVGRPVNDGLEAVGLPRVLGEAAVKHHERNAFKGLLGPGVNQLEQTFGIGQKLIGGEYEKAWDQAARRIPLYNVWYIQALNRLMEK